jgi:putative oxidoreductase
MSFLHLTWDSLRRLFTTFARGWPGAGLLLMRLVAGAALIAQGIKILWGEPQIEAIILNLAALSAGLLLLVGLWTPLTGTIVAIIELWHVLSQPADPWTHILLATVGAALALIGPGAWSVDARLFGWKRIDIPTPKS